MRLCDRELAPIALACLTWTLELYRFSPNIKLLLLPLKRLERDSGEQIDEEWEVVAVWGITVGFQRAEGGGWRALIRLGDREE